MKSTSLSIIIGIVFFSTISLNGCCEKSVLIDDPPPGFVFLQNKSADEDFDSLIERSVIESELFRRKVLAGNDPDFIDPLLLAAAVREFCYKAGPYLKNRYNIESFSPAKDEFVKSIEGKSSLSIEETYDSFSGKWFGKWDQMDVDHHWGPTVKLAHRRKISIPNGPSIWLKSYQYCWVGDGYGINLVASDDLSPVFSEFLLGYVVHVKDGDMTKALKGRPHAGILSGKDRIIWFTPGEVFLEQIFWISEAQQGYVITGFFYEINDNVLETTQCFQAVYTRGADNRPEWYSFGLKLKVDRLQ